MSPDELADALWRKRKDDLRFITRTELRTLAREAAKQALLDAADSFTMPVTGVKVRPWLRARAEQIDA